MLTEKKTFTGNFSTFGDHNYIQKKLRKIITAAYM